MRSDKVPSFGHSDTSIYHQKTQKPQNPRKKAFPRNGKSSGETP